MSMVLSLLSVRCVSVFRYSLIKEIKEYPLYYYYADISLPDVNIIFIYIFVKTDRMKELDAEFDFNIFI
jgi:hypothetical protein